MTQTHDHDHDAHGAIQSSSGVNEFEVLEQAVRELAIEMENFTLILRYPRRSRSTHTRRRSAG